MAFHWLSLSQKRGGVFIPHAGFAIMAVLKSSLFWSIYLNFWFIGFFPDKGKIGIEEYRCLSQKAKTEDVSLGATVIPAIPHKVETRNLHIKQVTIILSYEHII